MRRLLPILLILMFGLPVGVCGESPLKVLEKNIDETIRILKDPPCQKNSCKDVQLEKLWEIAGQVFDFKEISRRSLGASWNRFTFEQRIKFTDLFAQFLARYYLTRLQQKYRDEKVTFLNQKFYGDSRARVKIEVWWNNLLFPVDVWMLKHNDTWKAYDVVVLGVSAVQNYRAQFQELMLDKTPAQIIELVKKRLAQEGK